MNKPTENPLPTSNRMQYVDPVLGTKIEAYVENYSGEKRINITLWDPAEDDGLCVSIPLTKKTWLVVRSLLQDRFA